MDLKDCHAGGVIPAHGIRSPEIAGSSRLLTIASCDLCQPPK
jgi:hypothetical protein